jgi:hypothetical protein
MNWYDAHYQGDPAAGNVFGRENLRERCDPLLRAYLANGGRLSDFIREAADRPSSQRWLRLSWRA